MIHIEVQSDKDLEFPRRMYIYNYRIFDKSYRPVTSLAILADEVSSWRPDAYTSEQWGCKINEEEKNRSKDIEEFRQSIKDLASETESAE